MNDDETAFQKLARIRRKYAAATTFLLPEEREKEMERLTTAMMDAALSDEQKNTIAAGQEALARLIENGAFRRRYPTAAARKARVKELRNAAKLTRAGKQDP
jgi:hypothetical protein